MPRSTNTGVMLCIIYIYVFLELLRIKKGVNICCYGFLLCIVVLSGFVLLTFLLFAKFFKFLEFKSLAIQLY